MATTVATLQAELRADIAHFKKGMKQADKQLNKLEGGTKKASKGLNKMDETMKKMALGLAAAAIAKFGKQVIMLASDAEEAASAFKTTFGPAVDDAAKFVNEWALSAGFATHELKQLMATSGNIAQGIGATERESSKLAESMARLAGDVASFSNAAGGAPAVLAALQSALTGEREALKTYGIVVSEADVQQQALLETGKESASELTRLEKAQATMTIAYERAGKAVGDLERTQDGFANTLRRVNAEWTEAKVKIGEALLPIASKFLPALSGGVKTISDFGAGLLVITDAFRSMPPPVQSATIAVTALAAAFRLLKSHPILIAIGAITSWVVALGNAAHTAEENMVSLQTAVNDFGDDTEAIDKALLRLASEKGLIKWARDNGISMTNLIAAMKDGKAAADILRQSTGDDRAANKALSEIINAYDDMTEAEEAATEAAMELEAAQESLYWVTSREVDFAFRHLGETIGVAADETGELATRLTPLRDALGAVRDNAAGAATALHSYWLESLAATSPVFRAAKEWEALQETIKEAGRVVTPEEAFGITEQQISTLGAFGAIGGTLEDQAAQIARATEQTIEDVMAQFEAAGLPEGMELAGDAAIGFANRVNAITIAGITGYGDSSLDNPSRSRESVTHAATSGAGDTYNINIQDDFRDPNAARRLLVNLRDNLYDLDNETRS